MADYIPTFRSNYFRVRDPDRFKQWVARFPELVLTDGDADTSFALLQSASGYPPSTIPWCIDNGDDIVEVDFLGELAQHLAKGEVAIFIEIGYEKLRYLTGIAIAVNAHGERIQIALADIYKQVKEQWGIEPTLAEY